MLSEKILDVLDENDFSHSPVQVEKDFFGTTQCYVEIGWYSPAGEDFSATIWFDGTDEDFVEKLAEYANDFDVDDHVSMWADSLGRNGVSARTVDEAHRKACDAFCDADFGELTDIDGCPVCIEDEDGQYLWEK